jgi:methyltransferase (TIGR00027 family)
MKAGSASSTALLIARSLLLAEATPELRPLLLGETAALTRRLLDAAGAAPWFEIALRHRLVRRGLLAVERMILPGIILHWLVRKRLLDAHARDAIAGGCRQLVVLGAGLDTLAWRLRGECAGFEIDHPATQAIKARVLDGEPVLLAADLLDASPARVLAAEPRYDAEQPAMFVAEGLLMYLPPARVAELFAELAAFSAPGSRFAFTFMEARPGKPLGFCNGRRVVNWWLRVRGEPFRWGLARADAESFLARHGWRPAALSSPEEMRRSFLEPHGLAGAPLAIGESVALAYRGAS